LNNTGSGNGKDRGPVDEAELPDQETLKKLDLLATAKLSELGNQAPVAETVAVKVLIGDVTSTTVL
jgi:hypothetical protein